MAVLTSLSSVFPELGWVSSTLLWLLMILLTMSWRYYNPKLYFKERLYSLAILVVLRMLATLGVQYTLLITGIIQVRGQEGDGRIVERVWQFDLGQRVWNSVWSF